MSTKNDIVQQQQKIIAALRSENEQLKNTIDKHEQTIEYLRAIANEYQEFKAAFGTNGMTTYNQAMQIIQTRQNTAIEQERQRINYDRRAAIEVEEAAKHDAEVKQILKEYPNWQQTADENKAKVQQTKENMLSKVEEFYNLPGDKAQLYYNIAHKPENSAVKHLINEITEGGDIAGKSAYVYYQCGYCQDGRNYSTLADLERHCWNEGEDHYDANINRIETEARQDTSKINLELKRDIDDSIRAKKDTAYKKQLAQERAAQTRAAKDLPFVTKS